MCSRELKVIYISLRCTANTPVMIKVAEGVTSVGDPSKKDVLHTTSVLLYTGIAGIVSASMLVIDVIIINTLSGGLALAGIEVIFILIVNNESCPH